MYRIFRVNEYIVKVTEDSKWGIRESDCLKTRGTFDICVMQIPRVRFYALK